MSVDSISPKSFLVDEDCAKVEDVGFVDEEEEKSKHEHTAEEKAISQKKYEKYEVSNKIFFTRFELIISFFQFYSIIGNMFFLKYREYEV